MHPMPLEKACKILEKEDLVTTYDIQFGTLNHPHIAKFLCSSFWKNIELP